MAIIAAARIVRAPWWRHALAYIRLCLRVVAPFVFHTHRHTAPIARVRIPEYAGGGHVDVLPLGISDCPIRMPVPGPGVGSSR